jgi:hypothetical protein
LADATDPLYKSLDDGQKRRFAMLSRMGGRDLGGRDMDGRGMGGGRRWHRGRDRDGWRHLGSRNIEFQGLDRPREERL